MQRSTKNTRAADAMRQAIANGATDRAQIIAAGAQAIGGQEDDSLIALMVWRKKFETTEAN